MSLYDRIVAFGESSGVPTLITDQERQTKFMNGAYTDLCGYAATEFAGRNPGQILQGPETNAETVARIRRALRAHVPFEATILNYDKTAEPYIAGLYVMPFHDHGSQQAYFVALARKLPDAEQSLFSETEFATAAKDLITLISE